MELSARFTWFLITLRSEQGVSPRLHSVACYWETDVQAIVRSVAPGALASLQWVEADSERLEDWRLRSIRRVWELIDAEAEIPVLLFEDAGGILLSNQVDCQLTNFDSERKLVVEIGVGGAE